MTVTVRPATTGDATFISDLGVELYATTSMCDAGITLDQDVALASLAAWLSAGDRFGVFVAEVVGRPVGAIGIVRNPSYFGRAVFATELFFGRIEAFRGEGITKALIKAAEDWARDAGATHVCFLAVDNAEQEAVEQMLFRRGYSALETTWCRRI